MPVQALRGEPGQFAVKPGMHEAVPPLCHEQCLQPWEGVDFFLGQTFRSQLPARVTRKDGLEHPLPMELTGQIEVMESREYCLDNFHSMN
jgi:hypothetical protein